MKPIIVINQIAIVKAKLDIDFIDAVILDFICATPNWNSVVKLNKGDDTYYWVSYKLISKQLPMLKMKKDSIYRRVKHLAEVGLIDILEDSQKVGKTFLKITSKAKALFFTEDETIDNTDQSDASDENPKGFGNKSEGNGQNKEKEAFSGVKDQSDPSDIHPNPFGFSSELIVIDYKKEKEEEKINKKEIPKNSEEEVFSFSHSSEITTSFLENLAREKTPIDLNGQRLFFHNYKYLKNLTSNQLYKEESKKEAARVCDTYRDFVLDIALEVYEKEIAVAEKQSEIPELDI
jgi:hypothetical protein